jgi:pyruvate dehydrogenase E2 component (dihydrolipoamide acetyltransferase)
MSAPARIFALPDLGEGLQEAEIVAWLVSAGDHVVADQPMVSVETEKAVVEIPAPRAGRIAKLCAAPGARIKVGAPLVEYEDGVHPDTGTVVGELAAAPAVPPAAVKAAPAVRQLAKARGVDLTRLVGSGPSGAIVVADVERAAAGASVPGGEPLTGVRRAMAQNMARSGAEVVPATVTDEADVEAWPPDADPTLRLIRAVVAGCAAAPALNAWYDGRAMARTLHERIDLGLAVDTPEGLFVPVLRDVGRRDDADLRAGLERLKADVRARVVPLAELRGQTITLSNFGMLGGRHAALAIVPPQVAILGAGRIAPAAVARGAAAVVRRLLPLSLTFDHRCVTGGEAMRFLGAAIAALERAN